MDALRISSLGSAPTGAGQLPSAFDTQVLAVPPAPDLTELLGGTADGAAAPAGTALSATSVAQEASLALLAVLNPSQTPEASVETPPAALAPEAPQAEPAIATASNANVSPSPTSSADAPSVPQRVQDTATADFALQTALRFGSGVGAAAGLANPAPSLASAAIRQPEAVLRASAVESQSQGAASGTFSHSQTARQALQTYAPPAPSPEAESQVDLLV